MARKKNQVPGVAPLGDPHEDAFLRTILEHPDEDTPRLVYADWLQERGNPWGEYIRCAVLAAQKKTPAAQRRKLSGRADELLAAHGEQWLSPVLDRAQTELERGFVTTFELEHATDPPTDSAVAPLADRPIFALAAKHVGQRYLYRHFSLLARLPRLGCLGKLTWEGHAFGCDKEAPNYDAPEGPLGALFMASPHLAGLTELHVANCGLKNKALVALARNPAVAGLRVLDLGADNSMEVCGNFFDHKGVKALAESAYLARLEELSLEDGFLVGDRGARHVLESPQFTNLRKLNLCGIDMTDQGAQRLARTPSLARLEELRLGRWYYQGEPLGDPAARALAASPYLENIQRLELVRFHDVAEDTVAALRQRFGERIIL
jgi:uncharacterized protein (TIGR02996 family)